MSARRPNKAPTQGQAQANLTTLIIMADAIDRLSVDSLARSYRVPRHEIERMLAAETTRRARA